MTILGRSIVESNGYEGAPGINVIHWSAGLGPGPTDTGGVEEWHDTLETALSSHAGVLIAGAVWTISPDVAYFDDSDGELLGVTVDPGGARIWNGAGAVVNLSRATQACVQLRTDQFINGRRLRGRMFLGPVAGEALDNDGQIEGTTASFIDSSMSGLISGLGGRLAVWHRPTSSGTPPVSNNDGSYGDVEVVQCNLTPGTLRSRKT